jgi:plastocyanin
MKYAVLLSAILAACGGDTSTTTKLDATGSGSGSGSGTTNKVTTVSCTGATIAATVTTGAPSEMVYTPKATTITAGQIVEFKMGGAHNVRPSLTNGDPGLLVEFGADTCLKFSTAGTFGFYCQPHGFTGTVTVN